MKRSHPVLCLALVLCLPLLVACSGDDCTVSPCSPRLELDLVAPDGQPVERSRGEVRFDGGSVAFACEEITDAPAGYDCAGSRVFIYIPVVDTVDVTVESDDGVFEGRLELDYQYTHLFPSGEEGRRYTETRWWSAHTIVLE